MDCGSNHKHEERLYHLDLWDRRTFNAKVQEIQNLLPIRTQDTMNDEDYESEKTDALCALRLLKKLLVEEYQWIGEAESQDSTTQELE